MFNSKDIKILNKYPGIKMPAYLAVQVNETYEKVKELARDGAIEADRLSPESFDVAVCMVKRDDPSFDDSGLGYVSFSVPYGKRNRYLFAANFWFNAQKPIADIKKADFYPLKTYYTNYLEMNGYQLAWYLYWRKEFLLGNTLDTDYSYVCLLSYELINFPFVSEEDEFGLNISILEHLCEEYEELYGLEIKRYQRRWLEDLKYEVGIYEDPEKWELRASGVANAIERGDLSLSRTSDWVSNYNYTESSLTNAQIKKLGGCSQKLNNRIAKYGGKLAEYYLGKKVDLLPKWFVRKEHKEKREPYVQCMSVFDRPDLTVHYFAYEASKDMKYDMDEVVKIAYDLLYPEGKEKPEQFVAEKVRNGAYDLPIDFLEQAFPRKGATAHDDKKTDDLAERAEFSLDTDKLSKIMDKKIEIKSDEAEIIPKGELDIDFFEQFIDGKLEKQIALAYCLKNGKLIRSYIAELNEKYGDETLVPVVSEDGDTLILNKRVAN